MSICFSRRMGNTALSSATRKALSAAHRITMGEMIGSGMPKFLPPGQGLPIPTMTVMVFIWAGLAAAFVAFASSALPALRLKQMDIATALSGR